MKSEKIDKDIQKLRDKIADLQEQLKAKEQQRTDMENSEIVGMVRNLGVKPEDLAAFIKAFQAQRPLTAAGSEPAADTITLPAEQPEESIITTEAEKSYSTSTDYRGGATYDHSSDSGTERRYRFEDSED